MWRFNSISVVYSKPQSRHLCFWGAIQSPEMVRNASVTPKRNRALTVSFLRRHPVYAPAASPRRDHLPVRRNGAVAEVGVGAGEERWCAARACELGMQSANSHG